MTAEIRSATPPPFDDSQADRGLLAVALDEHGPTVETHSTRDGEEAMALLKSAAAVAVCRPDLIILDLNLFKLTGVETLAQLRSEPAMSGVPVAVLTNSDSPFDLAAAQALGVTEYLRKPMSLEELLEYGSLLLRLAGADASA